ncbi:MAG TPA: DUF3592 domain-containing protein [Herpetosiphonaceae bacterium]|nr:DUF3592 domain-containing protein [Herpetosiphonaceae bacterium]
MIVVCLAAALITTGLGLGALMATRIWSGWSSRRWPHCPGTIIESTVRHIHRSAIPIVRYAYEVDGQAHTGDTVQFLLAPSAADDAPARYPPGATAQVFYNPARPEQATLQPGVPLSTLAFVLVVVALGVGGGLWLILTL